MRRIIITYLIIIKFTGNYSAAFFFTISHFKIKYQSFIAQHFIYLYFYR